MIGESILHDFEFYFLLEFETRFELGLYILGTYLKPLKRRNSLTLPYKLFKKTIVSFLPERFRDGPTLKGFLRKKRSKVATSFIFPGETKSNYRIFVNPQPHFSIYSYCSSKPPNSIQDLSRKKFHSTVGATKKARLGKPQLVFQSN
jgi:hypothetical protein